MTKIGSTCGLAVAAAAALLWVGPAQAQQGQDQGTANPSGFSPSVSLMGTLGSNPQRVPGDTTRTQFVAATAELPFSLRSPRWSLAATYRPDYQYSRDDDTLTSFDHSGSFALRGTLSPRTRLIVEGDAYVSNELRGLDAADAVLPRTRQIRGSLDATLRQQLSARDTISFSGGYSQIRFPNGELIDSNSTDVGVGYGRALSPRATATLSGIGRVARFDAGRRSRSLSLTAGGRFRVARNTGLEFSGGVLWIEEDLGEGWLAAEQPGFTAAAGISHSIDRVGLRIRAERDMGTTSGLGRATLRDRIVGSVGWGTNRFSLVGLAGFARNATLTATDAPTPSVRTLTACGSGAARISPFVAVVGTVLYAHQLDEPLLARPGTDTFRVSLGIRLQARGESLSAAGGQFRFESITRDARVTC